MNRQIRRCALWMMLPAVILVLFVSLYPLLNSIQMSFTNKNILKPNATKFVGLSNFEDILTDPEFYDTIRVSLIYALGCAFASYAIGLGIATLLNKEIRFRGLFRAVLLIPWAIPTVVAASNWSYLLNDQYGPINTWLMNWGIIDSPILFLADTSLVLFTVVLVGTWKSYPFMALSLLAGMQNIDRSIYESAQIDGASGRQAFWYITLPGLKQVSLVVTTLMFIWGFNNFDIIFLLTSGGPLNATRSLSIYTYNLAFYRGRMGYSAAISLIMIPLFSTLRALKLVDTHFSLIFIYISTNLPFGILTMKGFFDSIPTELDEAAMIDGASPYQTYWKIVFPTAIPGMISVAVYTLMSVWNEFTIANIFIQSTELQTLSVSLRQFQLQTTTDWGALSAAAALACIPAFLFLIVVQKYLISGMTSGAVKG